MAIFGQEGKMAPDIDKIRSALFFLSPDTPRDEWVEIGMALKSELGSEGFELFDEWSRQSDRYNARDIRDTWKSCKPDGGITIATLYWRAKNIGWHYNGTKPTPEELKARKRESAKRAAEEKVMTDRERAQAAGKAAAIWEAAKPAASSNSYLALKGVSSVATLREIGDDEAKSILGYAPESRRGALVGRLLVVPVTVAGALSTLEFIDGDGRKHALAGGKKSDGHWSTDPLPDGDGTGLTLLLAEGVATALTGREATGHLVVAALTSGNLLAVAREMRQRYPAAKLVILADLIKATGEPDPHAEEAAQAIGGLRAIPRFDEPRPEDLKDFNDVAVRHGREAVRAAIVGAEAYAEDARRHESPGEGGNSGRPTRAPLRDSGA
jgi:putative DNA primase/helicase